MDATTNLWKLLLLTLVWATWLTVASALVGLWWEGTIYLFETVLGDGPEAARAGFDWAPSLFR